MHGRAWIMMGLLAALWGASYLFIKVALDDLAPATLVWARLVLGAAVLIPLAAAQGALAPLRGALKPVAVVASVQIIGPFILIAVGEQEIASSLAGILVASAGVFTALLAMRDPSERLGSVGLVGVAVGIVGVALLLGVDASATTATFVGGLMVVAASLGYAVGSLYLRRHLSDRPPLGVAAASMTFSALALTPAPIFAPPDSVALDTAASVFALGVGGTGIAFGLFYLLIADVGPARSSVVAYIAPVFAVLYGVTILDEGVTAATFVGLVLVLIGSWLAAEGRMPWHARLAPAPPEPA